MKIVEKQLLDHFTSKGHTPIFYGYRGSIAHGTYILGQSSDIDLFVVSLYPKQYYFGLGEKSKSSGNYTQTINDIIYDVEYFEVCKFLSLILNNSPNCINYLFIDKSDRIVWNEELWNYIENNYTEFVSTKYIQALMCWSENMLKDYQENPTNKKLACAYQYIKMAHEYIFDKQIKTNRSTIDANKIKDIKQGNLKLTFPSMGLDILEEIRWLKFGVEINLNKVLLEKDVNKKQIENDLNKILWNMFIQEH